MRCALVVDDGASQRIATLAGAGLSINSLWSVEHDLAAGRLVRVLPDWRLNDHSVLWLVYPRSNVLTAKTRTFMDYLIETLGRGRAW
ncbi:LysR substrate-binding domain-containing protein [Amorphus coralli]|uniref:LysR substrate-binding domain-containing protein n=1 Tax=Amorphus coralli TaxID=340680 RepID=UPI0003610614|nr:LysR substrate-binding domain-containing protein [Amorphus coralli]